MFGWNVARLTCSDWLVLMLQVVCLELGLACLRLVVGLGSRVEMRGNGVACLLSRCVWCSWRCRCGAGGHNNELIRIIHARHCAGLMSLHTAHVHVWPILCAALACAHSSPAPTRERTPSTVQSVLVCMENEADARQSQELRASVKRIACVFTEYVTE
jgi:hypothetical protein